MVDVFEGRVTPCSCVLISDWVELGLEEVEAEKEGRGVDKESAEEAGEGEAVKTK